ncbi:hypothetical protein DL771_005796 [Monosporascus sp. 5C6A]|nr:hypothetical protein DL771_005796 [Monosporascus sp. 5C6A]
MTRSLLSLLSLAAGATACVRDWEGLNRRIQKQHAGHSHAKRQEVVEYPPVLTENEATLVNSFDNNSISQWSHYYTHGDHLGGHNKSMAEWTADRFREAGLDASLAEFPIYATYPIESRLALIRPDGSIHNVSLVEDVLEEDDTSNYPNVIPAFHAMSGNGSVKAEYIYVGRGTQGDFAALKEAGIELEGKIALSSYGGGYRGLKDNGMAGCVLFTDPGDDGEITEANGYLPYPDGPARNPSSIQRGSVRFSSLYSGDPTTVGYASYEGAPRNSLEKYTPSIPSIPISMKDALPLLRTLEGHGLFAEQLNRSGWVGGFDVAYSSGPAPGAVLDLHHFMSGFITPVWDVIGVINGTSSDDVLIIGNHRDAWVIGGAADPNSGTAVLVELARAFGKLLEKGWKPKRTIILGSWDAEEFGLQGSTEWVETHLPWLVSSAVAYLNLDIAVSGPRTSLAGSGEIQTIAIETMKKVLFPDTWGIGPTLYDMWYNTTEGEIPPLGSGSDYAAFYHAGISAIDMGSDGGRTDPIYHYHSNYDSYHWMSTYADPGFRIHTAMGQWLTLLAYHIADDAVIPWDLPNAARVLRGYFSELNDTIADAGVQLDTAELEEALDEFAKQADNIKAVAELAEASGDETLVAVVNSKYKDFARGYVSQGGLPGRPTFHNVLSAPGIDNGYSASVFPPVTEGVGSGDLETAAEWVSKSAKAVLRAADVLKI